MKSLGSTFVAFLLKGSMFRTELSVLITKTNNYERNYFVKRSAVLLGLLAFLGISSHAENKVVLKNPGLKVGDQFGLHTSGKRK